MTDEKSGLKDDSSSTDAAQSTVEVTVKQRVFKVIVIGDSNVGKTCLTFRFCGGKFPEKTEATIGVDFREKLMTVDGEHIKIQLWDTAGQERFRKSMVQHYYRNVNAIVFVYDVTKMSSFESLPHWIEECTRHNMNFNNIPTILVGNKCDYPSNRISVGTNIAQKFADRYNMPLFETSAKDDSMANHVEAIFWTLAQKLKTSKPLITPLFQDSDEHTVNGKLISVGRTKSQDGFKDHFLDDDVRKSCLC